MSQPKKVVTATTDPPCTKTTSIQASLRAEAELNGFFLRLRKIIGCEYILRCPMGWEDLPPKNFPFECGPLLFHRNITVHNPHIRRIWE